jgi:8-amino-7-oxononanoate synthase
MPLEFVSEHLEVLRAKGLYRRMRALESAQDSWVMFEGRRVLNLCSNNYLGLAGHPEVKKAAAQAIERWGCGSGASRLICGTLAPHRELESRLAVFKGTEAALLYSSGYAANMGIIPAIVGEEDAVFSDELNHASIIDGCRLSRARVAVFPHNNLDVLESKLRRVASGKSRRKLIVVDSVFSMDGDLAPLPELAKLAEKYGCLLMVDEAHATGVLGPGGRGLVTHFGLEESVTISMSTLSKALGSLGGFAAGSSEMVDFLINKSRSFIYTTALSPGNVAAAGAALTLLENEPSLTQRVLDNAKYLRLGFKRLGFDTRNSETQIIPVMVGDAAGALKMSGLLLDEGVLATAVRPPTVPDGTCRIRVTVMATHTRQDLDFTLYAFEKAGMALGLI